MKIINLLDDLDRGGKETLALDLLKNAKRYELDLITVATGGGGLEKDFEKYGKSTFIRLQRNKPIDLRLVKAIRRIIIDQNIDIIHAHSPVEGIHAYLAARHTNCKVALSHHGYYHGLNNLKDRLMELLLNNRVNANVFVSNSFENGYGRKTKNSVVIYNGIDFSRLKPTKSFTKTKSSKLKMGMVGNFNTTRSQDTICRALKIVKDIGYDFEFDFVGGDLRAVKTLNQVQGLCYKLGLDRKVKFLGFQDNIGNFLQKIDIFVYSSVYDTFGIAFVEAIYTKKHVIASNIPALFEISKRGKYAELFEATNHNDLAKKIIKVAKGLSQINVREASSYVKNEFSIENYIKNLKKLYRSLE